MARQLHETFSDETSWNPSNWTNMFTSRLFFIGLVMLGISCVTVGYVAKKRTGQAVEIGNPTVAPLLAGGFFVPFAAFTVVPRHDPQQPVVGAHRGVRDDSDGPRRRRARRPGEAREGRQVVDLHAAGHLARRRLGDLAVHVRAPRRQRRADRPAERPLGRPRPAQHRQRHSRRSSSVVVAAIAARPAVASVGRALVQRNVRQGDDLRASPPSSSAGSSSATSARASAGSSSRTPTARPSPTRSASSRSRRSTTCG